MSVSYKNNILYIACNFHICSSPDPVLWERTWSNVCCMYGVKTEKPLSSFSSSAPTYLEGLSLSANFKIRRHIDSCTKNLNFGFLPTTVLLVTLWGICILCTPRKWRDETRNWKVWN